MTKFRIIQKQSRLSFVRWFSLLSVILLFSCNNKKDVPDVSHIKTNVTIYRFDKDFFSLDTNHLQQSLQVISDKYPAFLPVYFEYFAPVKDIAQQNNLTFDKALIKYYRNFKPLYNLAAKKFTNADDIKEGLDDNLRYVKYYFPSFKTPVVLTSVESLNPESSEEIYGTTYYQDTLVISLQLFLGKDYQGYDPTYYPDYLRRRFEPQFIVPNSIRAIASELYRDTSQSANLIEQMIEKGKQWWLMKKFLPNTADSLITGYNAQQTEWLKNQEGNVWGAITQHEDLFSIDQTTIQTYIGEGPFTQTLEHGNNGEGAPGNIGPWIGWRIIEKFEERNPKLSVQKILHTPARKIFEEAKYKPK